MSHYKGQIAASLFGVALTLLIGCGSSEKKEGGDTYSPSAPSETSRPPSTLSFSFDRSSVNLGSVAKYSITSSQIVTLTNTGTQELDCYSPYSYGPNSWEFTIVEDNCFDRPIVSGQQCTYRIRGSPSGLGERVVQYKVTCYGDSYTGTNAFVTFTMTGL